MGRWGKRVFRLTVSVGVTLLGVGLLADSAAVGEGVRRGLETCGGVLIPSLFPFMVLSGLLSGTDLGRYLSMPLSFFTTRLLKLPRELGAIVLVSLVGGYPVGAKSISSLLAQDKIDRSTAERMLCFCVNSGPSFLITAVGAGMLMQRAAGVILFATQTAATLLIGIAVSRRARLPEARPGRTKAGGASAFVNAVTGAAGAMITMCAFAVLFSGLLSLVRSRGIAAAIAGLLPVGEGTVQTVISGLFEVTAGCISAAQLGGEQAFLMTSAFVSFSGLSVLFQIMSCFQGEPFRFRPFLISRLVHAVLAAAMALPLYRHFCGEQAVFSSGATPVLAADEKTILISVCLLGMCTILLLSGGAPGRDGGGR